MKIRTTDDFLRIYCGNRRLLSFLAIEIIGFLALDNHAIRS